MQNILLLSNKNAQQIHKLNIFYYHTFNNYCNCLHESQLAFLLLYYSKHLEFIDF